MRKLLCCLFIPLLLSSCSLESNNINVSYLNYRYQLVRAGDIHGLDPFSKELLDKNPGYTSYIELFNKKTGYINFQCVGSSLDDLRCETQFYLEDINGNVLVNATDPVFYTSFKGTQTGKIVYTDKDIENKIGDIYVYTPYWCRWQCEYDVDGSGNKITLTFEFWKKEYNPLPDFISLE